MIWFYSDDPVRDAEKYDAWMDSYRSRWHEDDYDEYSKDDDFDEEE